MGHVQGPFHDLFTALTEGRIDRRQFLGRASALGMSTAGALFLTNVAGARASGGSLRNGFAIAAQSGAKAPDAGTENQKRGEGDTLKIIQWQAPTMLSPHAAVGVKDFLGACLVLEPLMQYLPDATIIPTLVKEVPSVENGLLAKDLKSVTYNLLEGVTWSDGEPFTANDVVFTWKWVMDKANASVSYGDFEPIASVEAVDDLTVKVTFTAPNPLWYTPHTGTSTGYIYPAHYFKTPGKQTNDAFSQKPIGTGPYKVDSFTPGDQVVYSINDKYREANKPYFKQVTIKGGGDAASAARAVIQTGEFDYAWNLQVEPAVLKQMESGGKGKLLISPGANVERIDLNQSDPNKEVDGQRSEMHTPNPHFSDPAVREAIASAIDRDKIASQFYSGGDDEPAAKNIIEGIPAIESKNSSFVFDTDKANKTLDAAGWTKDGDVRKKDGVELKLSYATSVNEVRQKTQAVVKANLKEIGIQVDLKQVPASSYFDSGAGNEQNISHFYWDMEMYQQVPSSPTPLSYMESWYAGKDGSNIAQKSNQWQGQNYIRYNNPEYDKRYEAAKTEVDAEKLAQLFIEMNDLVINDHVTIPLVRVGSKAGVSATLNVDNIADGAFTYDYWNIANWNRKQGS